MTAEERTAAALEAIARDTAEIARASVATVTLLQQMAESQRRIDVNTSVTREKVDFLAARKAGKLKAVGG